MTVADLIAVLQDMDPRARVVTPADVDGGARYALDILAVYRCKAVNMGPGRNDEDLYRLFRLGTPGKARVDDEEVVLIDDGFGRGLEHARRPV